MGDLTELRNKVESVLFSSGRKLGLEELSKLCREKDVEKIKQAINELKKELDEKQSALMLIEEGNSWKLTVREKYLSLVRKIVTKTELSKSVLETLAVVAFKAPVLQSKVVKIRTNKAYDHLARLEEAGYITREKSGRTRLIKLTQRFFDYFDIPLEKLKERFGNMEQLEKAIEEKEKEIEEIQKPRRKEESSEEKQVKEPEIDLLDKEGHEHKLDVYDREKETRIVEGPAPSPVEEYGEKLDGLEVYDTEKEHKKKPKKQEEPKKEEEIIKGEVSEEKEETKEQEIPEQEVSDEEVTEEKPEKEEIKKVSEQEQVKAPEEETQEAKTISEDIREKEEKRREEKFSGKGLFPKGIPESIQQKIEERVEELVKGEKKEEETEEDKESGDVKEEDRESGESMEKREGYEEAEGTGEE